jgi:hypothetical protein
MVMEDPMYSIHSIGQYVELFSKFSGGGLKYFNSPWPGAVVSYSTEPKSQDDKPGFNPGFAPLFI